MRGFIVQPRDHTIRATLAESLKLPPAEFTPPDVMVEVTTTTGRTERFAVSAGVPVPLWVASVASLDPAYEAKLTEAT